ncbi:MAG: hypothetical protein ABL931_03535 [Usitatibacteraceae bacterium]
MRKNLLVKIFALLMLFHVSAAFADTIQISTLSLRPTGQFAIDINATNIITNTPNVTLNASNTYVITYGNGAKESYKLQVALGSGWIAYTVANSYISGASATQSCTITAANLGAETGYTIYSYSYWVFMDGTRDTSIPIEYTGSRWVSTGSVTNLGEPLTCLAETCLVCTGIILGCFEVHRSQDLMEERICLKRD